MTIPSFNKSLSGNSYLTAAQQLTDDELKDMKIVRAVRLTCYWLTVLQELSPLGWRRFLYDMWGRPVVPYYDVSGKKVYPDMEPFEASDSWADHQKVTTFEDNLRSYLNDNCCKPVGANEAVIVTQINRARFVTIAGVIESSMPFLAVHWPRHPKQAAARRVETHANDNFIR